MPNTTQKTMQVAYINCDTCAHCVDFHTPTDDQPEALTVAQKAVAEAVAGWLDEAKAKREAMDMAESAITAKVEHDVEEVEEQAKADVKIADSKSTSRF